MGGQSAGSDLTSIDEIADSLSIAELDELCLILFSVVVKGKRPIAIRHCEKDIAVWLQYEDMKK